MGRMRSLAAACTIAAPIIALTGCSTGPQRVETPPTPSTSSARRGSVAPLVVLNPGHNGANGSHPREINRHVPAGFGMHKTCDTTGTSSKAGSCLSG